MREANERTTSWIRSQDARGRPRDQSCDLSGFPASRPCSHYVASRYGGAACSARSAVQLHEAKSEIMQS